MSGQSGILLIGEIFVDFVLPTPTEECKVRLGGIVHAARGIWAIGGEFSVAAVCPAYLVESVHKCLEHLGCTEFIWLADVKGAPNVMAIGDPTEVADQAYQDILRDEKSIEFCEPSKNLKKYRRCLIFPGKFNLPFLAEILSTEAEISFDIAYDLKNTELLADFKGRISALITSTSSGLFLEKASTDVAPLLEELRSFSPTCVLLKENRGGSRLFDLQYEKTEEIPALLRETANSVGVGDVYSAVFVYLNDADIFGAGWKAAHAATCYAQTTFLGDFKRDVRRGLALTVDQMRGLGGVFVPWHDRQVFQIYFAAPDFSYVDRTHIDRALEVLDYHNFKVRRPVQEIGELKQNSSVAKMQPVYVADLALLQECDFVFALPLGRDPGTLVELGIALASDKPVITYDPLSENINTIVILGSTVYSHDLDICLNGVFDVMSKLRTSCK